MNETNLGTDHIFFMRKAIVEASKAFENGEVPIGAVIVCKDKIIGKGYNQTEQLSDVTAHAEMLAITSASNYLNSKYLEDCTLYITIEPCLMCAGAIRHSRLKQIVIGASEPKFGFSNFVSDNFSFKNPPLYGVLEEEARSLMQSFFKSKRAL